MRWVVESESVAGLVRWPEERDDFAHALARDFRAEAPQCHLSSGGSVTARFVLEAESKEHAERVARELLEDVLAEAGLRTREPFPFLQLARRAGVPNAPSPI